MDLSRYDDLDAAPSAFQARYQLLRSELQRLCAADLKDMKAIDAVMAALDEVQAGFRDAKKSDADPQRF